MNAKTLSLAVLMLAGAASAALAQDHNHRWRDRGAPAQAPQPPQPREAPQAPAAPQARSPGPHDDGRRDGPRGTPHSGWRTQDRPSGWIGEPPGRKADRDDRHDRRDERPSVDGRSPIGPQDRWREERRDGEGRDWQRNEWDRRDWDRRDSDRRDWDRDRRDRPRWERHRYPPVYNSPSRYRGSVWRAPGGYYVRAWRYGEVLPRGWYAPEYRILDWWAYDLPEPPFGYEWIRVGRDVVLVDLRSGRIVQVVRLLFW